jgi:hypothetical protein
MYNAEFKTPKAKKKPNFSDMVKKSPMAWLIFVSFGNSGHLGGNKDGHLVPKLVFWFVFEKVLVPIRMGTRTKLKTRARTMVL